jgi:tetratricopeptide (TPR) repeat protein
VSVSVEGRRLAPPDPSEAVDAAGFTAALRRLKAWAGNPSYQELSRRTGIPRSTLADAMAGRRRTLPPLELSVAVAAACTADVPCWADAWRRLRLAADAPAAAEVGPAEEARSGAAPPSGAGSRSLIPVAAGPGTGVRPLARQLPADLEDFVGRGAQLGAVLGALRPATGGPVVVAVGGPAGIGKTALAIRVAHLVAADHPDGQLFLRLGGGSRPRPVSDVQTGLLRALGLDGSAVPADPAARTALLRDRLAERRMLLVFDDAADDAHLRPLLPDRGPVTVLVTSRALLTGVAAAQRVILPPLAEGDAVRLLARAAGRADPRPAALRRVAAGCGGVPLALRVAGAALGARPDRDPGWFADRLAAQRSRLDRAAPSDGAVRSCLEVSYSLVDDRARRLLRLLASLPVPSVAGWVPAALLDVAQPDADEVVDALVATGLLHVSGADRAGQLRYRLHDTVRRLAQEHAAEDAPAEAVAALRRAADGWLALALLAGGALESRRQQLAAGVVATRPAPVAGVVTVDPLGWFEAERPALLALIQLLAEVGAARPCWQLLAAISDFLDLRRLLDDWHRAAATALGAARSAGDGRGEAVCALALAWAELGLDQHAQALVRLAEAGRAAGAAGDPVLAAVVAGETGYLHMLTGRPAEAAAELRGALDRLRALGASHWSAIVATNLGFVLRDLGQVEEAVTLTRQGMDQFRTAGDRYGLAVALRLLGAAYRAAGRPDRGERCMAEAAALFTAVGDELGAAAAARSRADLLGGPLGRPAEALEIASACLREFGRLGDRWGEATARMTLAELTLTAGDLRGCQEQLRRVEAYWREVGAPALLARSLTTAARCAAATGDRPAARAALTEAAAVYRELGSPKLAGVERELAALG